MRQSHVSEALQRLRHIFADEVLVRVGQAMVPTLYMLEIAPLIENFIADVSALSNKATVPAEGDDRQFVIAAPDIVIAAIAPMLESLIITNNSRLTVKFIDFRIQASSTKTKIPETPNLLDLTWADADLFESGSIDMVIAPDPVLSQLSYCHCELYADELVYITQGHKHTHGKRHTDTDIHNRRSIACRTDFKNLRAPSPIGNGKIDMAGIAQTLLLPFFLSNTDQIALVTRRTARFFSQKLDLDIISEECHLPTIRFFLHWLRINEHDVQHAWLRSQLQDISKSL